MRQAKQDDDTPIACGDADKAGLRPWMSDPVSHLHPRGAKTANKGSSKSHRCRCRMAARLYMG